MVEPVEIGLINFKFRQDNDLINGKWFPRCLEEEIGLVKQKIKNNLHAYPIYHITTHIDSVNYNPIVNKSTNKTENTYVQLVAPQKNDSIITALRPDSLTTRELNTFHTKDSVGRKKNFDYKLKLLSKLMVGRLPISCFDIDYFRLYGFNKYEGSRLGIGLYTNEKISKHFNLGGYWGYGFTDTKSKYGGQVIVNIDKAYDLQLKISYLDDLKEVGLEAVNDVSLTDFRSYIGQRFDRCIQKKTELSCRPLRDLRVSASLNFSTLNPNYAYTYKGSTLPNYQANEVSLNLSYAKGYDQQQLGNQRIVNNAGNPIINLTYKRGLCMFNNESAQYNKIESTVDFNAYNPMIGQSNIRVAAGYIDQSLPYGLLYTGEGSKDSDLPIIMSRCFQTMLPYEFLSDKYLNIFYSHNFGSLLFKYKSFKPQFVIVQNSGWGSLQNSSYQGIDFKQKDQVYLETGLIINNLVKINYLNLIYVGIGVGGFYRYGYYGFSNFNDNLSLKLSLSASFK